MCRPEFQREPAQYLAKIQRANTKASKAEARANLSPALDASPGGLAFPGW